MHWELPRCSSAQRCPPDSAAALELADALEPAFVEYRPKATKHATRRWRGRQAFGLARGAMGWGHRRMRGMSAALTRAERPDEPRRRIRCSCGVQRSISGSD